MEVDIVCTMWLIQYAWAPLYTCTQKLLHNKHNNNDYDKNNDNNDDDDKNNNDNIFMHAWVLL